MRRIGILIVAMIALGGPFAWVAPVKAQPVIDSTSSMNFGRIIMDTASGDTLTLNPSTGQLTAAGSSALSGVTSAGNISISGTPNQSLSILPPSDTPISFSGGNATLKNFTLTGGMTQSLNGGGTLSLGVGCDLQYDAHITQGGPINQSISFIIDYN